MIRAHSSRRKPRSSRRVSPLAAALLFASSPVLAETKPGLAAHLSESVREAQKLVEDVRGVPFGGPVASAVLPEKDLAKLLEQKLVEDLPVPFDKYAASLVAVGLLDPAPDLLKKLVRLYARQVAGFYDPAEKKFYVVPERSAETSAQLGELGITTSDLMEEALLTHELTHALQDRRLGLEKRLKSLKGSTDATLAMESFLEGEATVVMIEALLKRLPEDARELLSTNMLTEMMSSLASGSANVEGSEGVPEFFVKELLFPYAAGTAWVQKKRALGGGWGAIEEAYRRPPFSTSEILHPDGTGYERAPLPEAEVPKTKDVPAGARPLYSDTLGEWIVQTLLERAGAGEGAAKLAAQRTDDRILFFERGYGKEHVGFLWRVRCSSPVAARSLGEALAPAWSGRPAPARPTTRVRGNVLEIARGLEEPGR